MGSADLLQTLFKNDLVDELQLMIFPITLGTGKRLFTDGTIPAAFKVTESQISPNGIIIVNYERAGEVKMGEPQIEQNDQLLSSPRSGGLNLAVDVCPRNG
jgi:dihydrofolate reductase